MKEKPNDWDSLICNVLTEMDRMFWSLNERYASAPETLILIEGINVALHEKLKEMDDSAKNDGLSKGNSDVFKLYAEGTTGVESKK